MPQELASIFLKMRAYRITQVRLAQHMGLSKTYVNEVLRGKRTPKHGYAKYTCAVNELAALAQAGKL